MLFSYLQNIKKWSSRIILLALKPILPTDFFSRRIPVSLKAIIIFESQVLLLKDENDTWDLPGGKIKRNEMPISCIKREVEEETNLIIEVINIEETLVRKINGWFEVFVVVYNCKLVSNTNLLKISGEHFDSNFFSFKDIQNIKIHEEYLDIISRLINLRN